jgi:hypothetical protein
VFVLLGAAAEEQESRRSGPRGDGPSTGDAGDATGSSPLESSTTNGTNTRKP